MVSIDQIKQLREETGLSISECKKALEDANGDMEKAKEVLKQWGKKVAEKKQVREVGEGLITSYVHGTGKIGVLVDIRCETDFVARSDDFKEVSREIALQVASMDPSSVEELLRQPYIKENSRTVKELISDYIAKLGENIVIHRFSRFQI
ncbi:MAG: translation elongation factor Ts [Candidatus Wildermuthbacteria bacterium RIFCSPHIGHO2_01_FULL_45_20]|uniref:Elongation factor Ts n=1 Tax=Candidatus Wildermuthbacteria bacterium RIFCSPHIGHO2_02_FULL_45_25 TaxID=1802450 RepID=A0A1G2R087_9BACT|nr:MAG: translation elongation factor Ts [Candidatus Wildermuthbacteria bacterium RIFCSPHIGHO2_01_FULL_45_20]OHA65491.1 MAG: translation elongation factor Ts [Candidatus Wildermuthbacteria bacterium RIFCSPHIGHO2_02_FULL_45_25]